jgi:hypothetical protein
MRHNLSITLPVVLPHAAMHGVVTSNVIILSVVVLPVAAAITPPVSVELNFSEIFTDEPTGPPVCRSACPPANLLGMQVRL